ncbi:MAG: ATP-binding protein [Terriglobia bacterium]|jgi:two-component system, NtrC family, sensor kinase
MRRLTHNLATKLTVCVVGSMALLLGLYGYWHLHIWRQSQQEMVFQTADRASDIIWRSIRYSMLRNEREEVFHIINTIGHEAGIGRIRIFNPEGHITFSTDPSEVGTFVDKKGEACYACHAQAQPLTRLHRPDRLRIYKAPDGTRVLGLIRPIENEPDCSNAACHAHAPGSQVLGVLDTNLSLASVDQVAARSQRESVVYTLASIILLSLISAGLIRATVHNPVRRLTEGTRHVAEGELNYSLPVSSDDELGSLAASFNRMTEQLKKAQEENQQWTRTLEERVQEKTGELERAYHRLVQSEKMASLGKLAAVVAHEINNPLAGILTYSKLVSRLVDKGLEDERRRAEAKSDLQQIEGESKRCGAIVKNLLTFARQAPLVPQENDLGGIVQRCLLLVGHQCELQQVEVESQIEPKMPSIHCDSAQIQQVLLALLMNAVEAMPHGGRLKVEAAYNAERREAQIVVSDDGMGIPEEVLPHIFEPFFTTKAESKGVGLGLAVAFGIVQQHGGKIAVSSTPQKGTTFTVTLPEKPCVPAVKNDEWESARQESEVSSEKS